MFKIIKLESDWWAVFLVSVRDEHDRYMVTSPVTKKEAEHFYDEFLRIIEQE